MSLGVFSAGGVIFSSFRVLRQMPGESQAQNRGRRHFSPFLGFPGISGVLLRDPLGGGGVGDGGSGGRGLQTPVSTPAGVGQKPTQNWKAVILQLNTHTHTHTNCRNFPGVQGLRRHTPSAGGQGSIPGPETDPMCHS